MTAWTYYSPLWLGVLLVLAANEMLRGALPRLDPWLQWLVVGVTAANAGLAFQALMIGAQGAFAQVLPVPRGRSIRGGAAVLAGWLIIAGVVLGGVSALLGFEEVSTAAVVIGVLSLAAWAGAVIVYIWSLPAAVRDFSGEEHS